MFELDMRGRTFVVPDVTVKNAFSVNVTRATSLWLAADYPVA